MFYRKVLRLVLGGALVAACAESRHAQSTAVKQNVQNKNIYGANATPDSAPATSAATSPTDKQNDFVLLEKNKNPEKHVRNIMIVNKHKEDRLRAYNEIEGTALPERLSSAATQSKTTQSPATARPAQEPGAAGVRRARTEPTHSTRRAPRPPADILDMAAARGSRVDAKRLKGRLCQRHVLLPEGPKYDGAGRVYLAAHAGPRPFANTRRPRLLLPNCCNCCKKSVLGCE